MSADHESMSSADFLARHQALYGGVTGLRWQFSTGEISVEHLLDDTEFMELLKKRHGVSTAAELRALLVTPFDEETDKARWITRFILEGLNDNVDAEIKQSLRVVPIGSLPTRDANAATVRAPSGDPVILIDMGVLALLHTAARAYVGAFPTPLTPPRWSFRQATEWIIQWCVAMALGNALLGIERVPKFRDPARMMGSASIADNATAFLIGHEYSHILLGHGASAQMTSAPILAASEAPELPVYRNAYAKEYEADKSGVELAVSFCRASHEGQYQMAFFGVAFFFRLIEVLYEVAPSAYVLDSHPSPPERLKRLDATLHDRYDDVMEQDLSNLRKFFDRTLMYAKVFSAANNSQNER